MPPTGTKFEAGIEQQRLTSLIISTVVLGSNSQPCNHLCCTRYAKSWTRC